MLLLAFFGTVPNNLTPSATFEFVRCLVAVCTRLRLEHDGLKSNTMDTSQPEYSFHLTMTHRLYLPAIVPQPQNGSTDLDRAEYRAFHPGWHPLGLLLRVAVPCPTERQPEDITIVIVSY